MKRFVCFILTAIIFQQTVLAEISVFSDNNKFGLKDENNNIIVNSKYKKLVRLGTGSWIMQDGTKFGIINDEGNIIVEPVYNQAERILGKYVKFRKGSLYCLLDEKGNSILEDNCLYSSIDLLYGGLIVTSKNHKYGLYSFDKSINIENIFDDIYMSDSNTLIFVYGDKIIEFKRMEENNLELPFDYLFVDLHNSDLKLSDFSNSPLATTGYYGVTITDYILKLASSISPAYEQTIDELMFSQGADTVSVLMKFSWLPKFPFTYAKNYYNNFVNPSNGPLYKVKKNLRKRIKN